MGKVGVSPTTELAVVHKESANRKNDTLPQRVNSYKTPKRDGGGDVKGQQIQILRLMMKEKG